MMSKYIITRITLMCLFIYFSDGQTTNGNSSKVLILGAGMAGISAAKTLTDLGHENFLILEGSDRIGGRLKQATIGGYDVEIGSFWLYGGGEGDPIWELLVKYDVSFKESDYDDYVALNQTGADITDKADTIYEVFGPAFDKLSEFSSELQTKGYIGYTTDTSERAGFSMAGWVPQNPLEYAIEYWDLNLINGQSVESSSLRYAERPSYEQNYTEYVVADQNGGYSKIVTGLASEFLADDDARLKLNSKVVQITHGKDGVTVEMEDGTLYTGSHVLVTFSLGVLQHPTAVTFDPVLPPWKVQSLQQFSFTTFTIIYVQFATPFWQDVEWALLVNAQRGYFPVWQNYNKHFANSNILQFLVTADEGNRVESLSDEEVQQEIQTLLETFYGSSIPQIQNIVVSRWKSDPLFYGSFSNIPVGYSNGTHQALTASVGRVHFAGEAYDPEWFGTVDGAYNTGHETAEKLMDCLTDYILCNTYIPPLDGIGCTYEKASNYDDEAFIDDGSCILTSGQSNMIANQFIFLSIYAVFIVFL